MYTVINVVGEGIYGEGKLLSAGDDPFFFFGLQLTVRLKLQFQSGIPLFKSLDPPLWMVQHLQVDSGWMEETVSEDYEHFSTCNK